MTLPFAFAFIIAFVIIAVFLIFRKAKGKKEVKNTGADQNSPQGPVDTTAMDEKTKAPLRNQK